MIAYWTSLVFVVLAEMGDKTQLLAMAFAVRYRPVLVLWGIFVATAVNHLLAVLAGNYLTALIPLPYIQIGAAGSFILFGIWTLRGDRLEGEDKRFSFSPFWTIAIAFFLAEMGDKTQLATVALAAKFQSIWMTWSGTLTGMMIADMIGIGIGIVMHKHIPDRLIKWGSALVFIGFGLYGLHENISEEILTPTLEIAGLSLLALLTWLILRNGPKTLPVSDEKADG
jgi:putative Ca2+/H+ antiporter (TMEM165/GDT1 family)